MRDQSTRQYAVESIVKANTAGSQWASSLKPGDVFLGASPAAMARGYRNGTPEYKAFVYSAVDELEKCIILLDDDGTITSIQEKAQYE